MAEYFHKMDDWELEKIAEGNSFFVAGDKIEKAYKRLKNAVDRVISKKEQIQEKIDSGNIDSFTRSVLRSEIERLDQKADDKLQMERRFKKSF